MRANSFLKKFFNLTIISAILAASAIITRPGSAATITVVYAFDSGPGSLRQAIIDANPGDTIVFNQSLSGATITLASQLYIDKSLIIDGSSLFSPITISGDNLCRVFFISINITVTLKSLVISNGYANKEGGGICNLGALTLKDSTISNNHTNSDGGGIYNEYAFGDPDIADSTLTVINSSFIGNSAENNGGGIESTSNQVAVTGSNFIGNTAQRGGGINCSGNLLVSNSTFSENKADINGGGICNLTTSTTLTNNIFNGNTAVEKGGAIYAFSNNLNLTDSSFSGNTAEDGGAIYNESDNCIFENSIVNLSIADNLGGGIFNKGNLKVTNSTIFSNKALYGGGIWNEGNSTLGNSTLSGNSAEYWGGGIDNFYADLIVVNSTLSGNTSAFGGGIHNLNGRLRFTNTLIANSISGGDCLNDDGTIEINLNNLVEDGSCDENALNFITGNPMLDDLGDYGGLTETHALLMTSPAIDAGDISTCIGPLINSKDQRGVTRPQGAGCDIGSYELMENHPPVFTSTPVTTAIVGEGYAYEISTTDPDLEYGDWLSIASKNALPGWLTLNDNKDGTASLAGTPGTNDEGSHFIELTVTDSFGATASQTFTIVVSMPEEEREVLYLPLIVR